MKLQRLAGNRVAAIFMAPRVVQRRPEDVEPAAAASTAEKIETAHRTKDVGDIKAIGKGGIVEGDGAAGGTSGSVEQGPRVKVGAVGGEYCGVGTDFARPVPSS